MKIVDKTYYNSGQVKQEIFYFNGMWHRLNGPAYISYYETGTIQQHSYFKNNNIFRYDGPPIIYYDIYGKIKSERFCFQHIDYVSLIDMQRAIKLACLI